MAQNHSVSIPEHIKKLKGYVAGKTIAEVKEAYNPDIIAKLASNENRLGFSSRVPAAVSDALNTIQDYPDPLSQKLRKKLAGLNHVKEDELLVAAGSESIISIICRTFFDDGDNAVTASATFVGFFVQAGVMGNEVKRVPVTNSYKYDVDGILDAIDENTKMVYLANPNNPTGTYLNKSEFEKLLDGIPDHVLIIADEAYFEFTDGVDDYPSALDYRRSNMILLRTFSKAYGLAGFRIGYAIAESSLINEMIKTKLTFEPTAPAQAAAFAALGDTNFLKKSVQLVKNGREKLYKFFEEENVRYAPSISNSVMMILDNEEKAITLTQAMLEEGVILRRIHAFGLPNCVRITIGTDQEMEHFRRSFRKVKSII